MLFLLVSGIGNVLAIYKDIRAVSDGDYIIGSLLDLHTDSPSSVDDPPCEVYEASGLLITEAIIFAIGMINDDPSILPNITLGYDIRDACSDVNVVMRHGMEIVEIIENLHVSNTNREADTKEMSDCANSSNVSTGFHPENCKNGSNDHFFCSSKGFHLNTNSSGGSNCAKKPIVSLIGTTSSRTSAPIASLLQLEMIPMISYKATSRTLGNKKLYPSFMRTIPSDVNQVQVMADVIEYFEWNYIAAIALDDEYGRGGMCQFCAHSTSVNLSFFRPLEYTEF